MYYISGYNNLNELLVTDTKDNITEMYPLQTLVDLEKKGVKILGIEDGEVFLNTSEISYFKLETVNGTHYKVIDLHGNTEIIHRSALDPYTVANLGKTKFTSSLNVYKCLIRCNLVVNKYRAELKEYNKKINDEKAFAERQVLLKNLLGNSNVLIGNNKNDKYVLIKYSKYGSHKNTILDLKGNIVELNDNEMDLIRQKLYSLSVFCNVVNIINNGFDSLDEFKKVYNDKLCSVSPIKVYYSDLLNSAEAYLYSFNGELYNFYDFTWEIAVTFYNVPLLNKEPIRYSENISVLTDFGQYYSEIGMGYYNIRSDCFYFIADKTCVSLEVGSPSYGNDLLKQLNNVKPIFSRASIKPWKPHKNLFEFWCK